MSPTFRRATLVAVALTCVACESYEEVAASTFSKDKSCPADRVTTKVRSGVDAHDLLFGKDADPPAEVKSDPARYDMWKKERNEAHSAYNRAATVVAVKGCDAETLYVCTLGTQADGTGGTQVKMCSPVTPRPEPAPDASH